MEDLANLADAGILCSHGALQAFSMVVKVASMLVAVELDGVVTARRGRAVVVGRLGLGVAGPS